MEGGGCCCKYECPHKGGKSRDGKSGDGKSKNGKREARMFASRMRRNRRSESKFESKSEPKGGKTESIPGVRGCKGIAGSG